MDLATTHDWREGAIVREADLRADQAAFQSFVGRNMRFAFRVAWALLRNRGDAEDVVQECFLRLHKKRAWHEIHGLAEEIRDERAYLARVVWRMARDRQRRPAREEGGIEMDTITATDHSPEAAAVSQSAVHRIHRMIDALPEELRQPLVLSSLEEMTSAQMPNRHNRQNRLDLDNLSSMEIRRYCPVTVIRLRQSQCIYVECIIIVRALSDS